MSTNIAKPYRVAIVGASGTYGKGILARAEEIGVEAEEIPCAKPNRVRRRARLL